MLNNKLLNFFIIFIFITGCAPKESAINGDVFLTMGNGTIKPVAGAEVYLFPLEVNLDSSFVDPLKLYINNAKFNISKLEVEAACKKVNEEIPGGLDEVQEWIIDGALPSDLELTCKTYADTLTSLTESINTSTSSANTKSESVLAEITLKEEELQNTKVAIYTLALNQGNILKNQQMAKVLYTMSYNNPTLGSEAAEYLRYVTALAIITNNSDYIIKQVEFEKALAIGDKVLDSDYKADPYLVELYKYLDTIRGANNFSGLISSYNKWKISLADLTTSNDYSEMIPGLARGTSYSDGIYSLLVNKNIFDANNRWLDENISSIPLVEVGCKKGYSWNPNCVPRQYTHVDIEFPNILDITFGEEIEKIINKDTKGISYVSKDVDWVAKGRATANYKDSNLHNQLKNIKEELSNLMLEIEKIKEEFNIASLISQKEDNQVSLSSCNLAIDVRDTQIEVKSCLVNIDNPDALVATINSSKTIFGDNIKEIFNSVTEDDLGYDNFEQLLNAYGQSRNAIKAVTSIQGGYEFLEVPNGNYVLFTFYEDRFNGVGHWFEEISIEENKKIDLNNLNYKKEGVYSYLRDKIEE